MNLKLKRLTQKLNTPWKIQNYVSALPYNPDDYCRSAERVFVDQTAHCLEGALLGCVLLEVLGHEPKLLHFRSHRDDRTPEDLMMSYFPFYFNTKGQMSLIAWAGPIRLKRYEKWQWRSGEGDISDMGASFYDTEKSRPIMSVKAIEKLPRAIPRLVDACFLGANPDGLFKA